MLHKFDMAIFATGQILPLNIPLKLWGFAEFESVVILGVYRDLIQMNIY